MVAEQLVQYRYNGSLAAERLSTTNIMSITKGPNQTKCEHGQRKAGSRYATFCTEMHEHTHVCWQPTADPLLMYSLAVRLSITSIHQNLASDTAAGWKFILQEELGYPIFYSDARAHPRKLAATAEPHHLQLRNKAYDHLHHSHQRLTEPGIRQDNKIKLCHAIKETGYPSFLNKIRHHTQGVGS